MMSILLLLMSLVSILFVLTSHPLTLGGMVLIQTILISITTGLYNSSYWYSYILFLIMIGGMLVLFIYMTNVASNEKFKFNKLLLVTAPIIIILSMITYFLDPFYLLKYLYQENLMWKSIENFSLSMIKYVNYPNILFMMLLILYLFVTLIAVVKLTDIKSGPLRQMF